MEPPTKKAKISETDADRETEAVKPPSAANVKPHRPIYENIKTFPLEAAPHRIPLEDTERWLGYLREHGYVVVRGVVNQEKVGDLQSKVWDFAESLGTGIDRNKKSTWVNANWPNTFSTGIISQYGVGQCEALWLARTDPNVRAVYEAIYDGQRDLLVSFDGLNMFRPPAGIDGEKWTTKGLWPHLDQNFWSGGKFSSSGLSVQGALNLIDSGPEDGGFICVAGSNKLFGYLHEKYKLGKPGVKSAKNFALLDPKHEMWRKDERLAKLACVKVSAGPGDLILWDSTVIHWNTPVTNVDKKYKGLARCVLYVCMAPTSLVQGDLEELRQKRRKCVEELKSTSHWPTFCHFSTGPRWPRKPPLKQIETPKVVCPTSQSNAAQLLLEGIAPPLEKKQ